MQVSARGGVVARLGGDEFGLIIDGKQPAAATALAERLAEALANEFQIDGKSVRTGVTTGISVFPHNGVDAASLLANAGAALFRAKAKSRGSISVYEPEMDRQIRIADPLLQVAAPVMHEIRDQVGGAQLLCLSHRSFSISTRK